MEPSLLDVEKNGRRYAAVGPQTNIVSGQKVKQAFWTLVGYDLGVLTYIIVLIGSCYWSHVGIRWLTAATPSEPLVLPWQAAPPTVAPACDPEVQSNAMMAANVGIAFGLFVVLYFCCFSFYLHCCLPYEALSGDRRGPNSRSTGGKSEAAVVGRSPSQRAWAPGMTMKLLACLCLDLLGDATYLMPGLDEEVDLAYAPAQSIALKMMFHYSALPSLGFVEEILPFTDAVPTATLGWLLDVFSPDTGLTRFIGIRSDDNP